MIKNITLVFILLIAFCSFGQQSKFSLEASFPVTFGDNFVDEGYNAVADLGLKYRFAEYKALDLGASLNVGAFLRDDTRFASRPEANVNAVVFQPRVYASFHLDAYPQIHPMVGLGYSIFAFYVTDENFNGADLQGSSSDDGVNLNLAIAYDIYEHFYLLLQYDYIKLSARDVRQTPYNQNVNIIKVGIGYRF